MGANREQGVRVRFTGNEDRARNEIIAEMTKGIKWNEVLKQLEALGFPARTIKSVRNRHLRLRVEAKLGVQGKNRCKVCGAWQRGHVWGGIKGPDAGVSATAAAISNE